MIFRMVCYSGDSSRGLLHALYLSGPDLMFRLKISVAKAEASVPADKRRILNAIAERDLDLEALPTHQNYDNVNQTSLHFLFVLVKWCGGTVIYRIRHRFVTPYYGSERRGCPVIP